MADEFLAMGDEVTWTLNHVYWWGVIVEMIFGMMFLCYGTWVFATKIKDLPFLLKTFAIVLLSDWFLAVNFFFRDWGNLRKGTLELGAWCKLSGFMAIFTSLICRMYFGVFAHASYRMVTGNPIGDKGVIINVITIILISFIICLLWLREDTYGSYKRLYCAIKESAYRPYLTAPCFLITFFSIDALLYYSYMGYEHMTMTKSASPEGAILLRRGFLHGLSHYVLWGGLIAVGCVTAVGGAVPPYVDMATAWILKTEPIWDTLLLVGTIAALEKPKGK